MLFLCHYQDLVKQPVQVHVLPDHDHGKQSIILVLHQNRVRAYNNQCPHAWVPLDAAGQDILSSCKHYLQCSSHFAQFRLQDGYCVYGPCQGRSLQTLNVVQQADKIYLQQDV